MRKNILAILITASTCLYVANSLADTTLAESKNLEAAKKFVNEDKGKEALTLLTPFLKHATNYDILILTAQAYAEADEPYKAFLYYQCAYSIAKDEEERRVANFGIAKMQFTLALYVRSADTYRMILNSQPNKEDHELALAGLVKSLAYYNRPRLAYLMILATLSLQHLKLSLLPPKLLLGRIGMT